MKPHHRLWNYTMILHYDTTQWYYTMILHHSTRLKIPLFSIAVYFENENNYLSAGKFYLLSEYYERALKLFMRCSSATKDSEHIILAIDTVGQVWVEKKNFLKFLDNFFEFIFDLVKGQKWKIVSIIAGLFTWRWTRWRIKRGEILIPILCSVRTVYWSSFYSSYHCPWSASQRNGS